MRLIHFLGLGVGVGAALSAGCQQAMVAPPPSAQVCNASCDVVVTVTETPTGPQPCEISVGNLDIKVEGHDRTIRWKMDSATERAKFRFEPQEGVKLKPGFPDPNHQFSDKGPQGGGAQYHWDDKNNEGVVKRYDYEIHVYKDNPHSGIKCKLDPRIWNS